MLYLNQSIEQASSQFHLSHTQHNTNSKMHERKTKYGVTDNTRGA